MAGGSNSDKDFDDRIRVENTLLNNRTMIFLASNGLWMAAIGFSDAIALQLIISLAALIVSILWVICGWQSWKVLKTLTKKHPHLDEEGTIERLVQEALGKPLWLRPTEILAKYIPRIVVLSWIAIIIWLFPKIVEVLCNNA